MKRYVLVLSVIICQLSFSPVGVYADSPVKKLLAGADSLLKRKSEAELVESKWIAKVFYGMRL